MKPVNLLPWRESLRQQRLRLWSLLLIGMPLIVLSKIVSLHLSGNTRPLQLLQEHGQTLHTALASQLKEVALLAVQVEKKEATAHKLASRLAENQRWEESLARLATTIPDNLWLIQMRYAGQRLMVDGVATTARALTTFETQSWLDNEFGPLRTGAVLRNTKGQLTFSLSWPREVSNDAAGH